MSKWHFLTITNGKFDVELAQANGIFASDIPVVIGGYGPKTPKCFYAQNRHFMGIIDEVRFWNYELITHYLSPN